MSFGLTRNIDRSSYGSHQQSYSNNTPACIATEPSCGSSETLIAALQALALNLRPYCMGWGAFYKFSSSASRLIDLMSKSEKGADIFGKHIPNQQTQVAAQFLRVVRLVQALGHGVDVGASQMGAVLYC